MRSMPPERAHFSYVLNPTLSPHEFLEMVLMDFGFEDIPESKSQRLMRLHQFLLQGHREGRTQVLIIDEAHKLTPELLEEVRLLTNFETAEQKLLQIILAGQTELTGLLNREDLRQLKQRIAVRVGVEALAITEVNQYMSSRWSRAGANCDLPFTSGAIKLIAMYSRGIPRVINSICDNALMNAFGDEMRMIDENFILEVAGDLQLSLNGYGKPTNGAVPGKSMSRAASQVFTEPPAFAPPPPVLASVPAAGSEGQPAASFKTLERYMPAPAKNAFWRLRLRVQKG
jgi:general secretion pathway protein A